MDYRVNDESGGLTNEQEDKESQPMKNSCINISKSNKLGIRINK